MRLKNLFIFLFLLFGLEAAASLDVTGDSDKIIVENMAKNLRKEFRQSGHQDVSTTAHRMDLAALDKHFDPSQKYFSYLEADEVDAVYRCHDVVDCEVYLISLSSNYWGGYGVEAFFITLNTVSRAHSSFTHTIYSE